MKHYDEVKAKHPDAILLLRSGDTYRVVVKDATVASQILGAPLIKAGTKEETGFPAVSMDAHRPK
ncbi:MAG: hypothetical protein LBH04_11830 [Tannerellaceae bacterium]|nr:hypothetical protein [Tannerellaceae bacterium]